MSYSLFTHLLLLKYVYVDEKGQVSHDLLSYVIKLIQ